jgi:voltage-gated potassium channel
MTIFSGRFKNYLNVLLLVEIFMLVFLTGFFPERLHQNLYVGLYAMLYLTTALEIDQHNKLTLLAATVLIALSVASRIWEFPQLRAVTQILNSTFFIYIVISFIRQIAGAYTVDKRVILQAVNGYMLLGIIFTFLIGLMVQFDNNSFNFTAGTAGKPGDFLYYGFVTFATLGYGDFVPIKPYSKSLSILISVSGQLYLAVIIALLVGKFLSQSVRGNND